MIRFLSFISLLSVQLVYSEECEVSVRPQSEVESNWKSNVPEEWRGLVDCKLKIYKKNGYECDMSLKFVIIPNYHFGGNHSHF